jgi:hypothetical protein
MSALDDYYKWLDAQTNQLLTGKMQGNSQQQWETAVNPPKQPAMTPGQYFRTTGRIFAGGTGDIPQKDEQGRITGYASRNRSAGGLTPGLDRLQQMKDDSKAGKPLASASGTPGLDALHAANPLAMTPGRPNAVAGNEQFGPSVPSSSLVVKKRTDLPASNTLGMMSKIFT